MRLEEVGHDVCDCGSNAEDAECCRGPSPAEERPGSVLSELDQLPAEPGHLCGRQWGALQITSPGIFNVLVAYFSLIVNQSKRIIPVPP